MTPRARSLMVISASLVWSLVVVVLLARVALRHERPGDPGSTPGTWPAATTLRRASRGATLVMLAHPRCPCTPASLEELARVVELSPAPVRTYVLVVRPRGAPQGFEEGPVWERCRELGLVRTRDPGGVEAAAFGARTSGHVTAWDPAGRLLYAGGITAAKGCPGDNPGRRALLAALAGLRPEPGAIYGCPLQAPGQPGEGRKS